ncbi:hypothetical protein T492DRAFT_841629 [Pavlovales sp. CCMP2436]|nr:hypothetical protein T492DRAFT_841629 [Pavlovales sp. CCMP2436]
MEKGGHALQTHLLSTLSGALFVIHLGLTSNLLCDPSDSEGEGMACLSTAYVIGSAFLAPRLSESAITSNVESPVDTLAWVLALSEVLPHAAAACLTPPLGPNSEDEDEEGEGEGGGSFLEDPDLHAAASEQGPGGGRGGVSALAFASGPASAVELAWATTYSVDPLLPNHFI